MVENEFSNREVLAVVTVCKDNPQELLTTCQSVAGQSSKPDQHVVIDSSDATVRDQMRQIATEFGASYTWTEPRGIYEAMLEGLRQAGALDYVWFLNATDWLASPQAIDTVKNYLEAQAGPDSPVWLVGRTQVFGELPHLLGFASNGEAFVRCLSRGRLGLPHSSTIVRADALRKVGAFEGPYRISRDYEMALKLAKEFGPPVLIPFPLSVYDESGESAQNAWRNVLHKSEARIKNQPLRQLLLEPIRILAAARRESLRRRLRKNPSNDYLWQALEWEKIAPNEARPFWEKDLG